MTEQDDTTSVPDDLSADIDDVLAAETGSTDTERAEAQLRATALNGDEANRIAARSRPTVLVLAGGVGSGKTSIYAALYERLGRGPFAGWMFAGSKTIPGFESRCHWWRTGAGGEGIYMEHTRAGNLPWLHLRLRPTHSLGTARELLLGDFDGELYEQLATGQLPATELPFLRRADHIGLTVDGEKLADPLSRAAQRQRTEYLLDQLLQGDGLAGPTALIMVLSKADALDGREDIDQVETVLAGLVEHASVKAGRKVPLVRLAVRSQNPGYPLGHGLETLLEYLDMRPAVQIRHPAAPYTARTALGRFMA